MTFIDDLKAKAAKDLLDGDKNTSEAAAGAACCATKPSVPEAAAEATSCCATKTDAA